MTDVCNYKFGSAGRTVGEMLFYCSGSGAQEGIKYADAIMVGGLLYEYYLEFGSDVWSCEDDFCWLMFDSGLGEFSSLCWGNVVLLFRLRGSGGYQIRGCYYGGRSFV